jgi:hypothetical protein
MRYNEKCEVHCDVSHSSGSCYRTTSCHVWQAALATGSKFNAGAAAASQAVHRYTAHVHRYKLLFAWEAL